MARDEMIGLREARSPSVMRRMNEARVLRVIREHGPMSRKDLAAASGLSKPTINEILATLLGQGLLIESLDGADEPVRRPGPKPRLLHFNERRWLVAGVDVGAAKILALISDLDGTVIASSRRRTPVRSRVDDILREIRRSVWEAVASTGAARDAVAAVVVGTPGVVDPTSGAVRYAPQLPDWEGHPLVELLRTTLSTPVIVESEAHLAVAGEHWRGAAQGSRSAVYVQLGVGVGMGYLIDGVVYPGATGAAGEIGYLPLGDGWPRPEGPEGRGVFEDTVGAPAFVRLAERAIATDAASTTLGKADVEVTAPAVLRAAAAGDAAASAIVDSIVTELGRGLACIAAVLNPEIMVLGGGVGSSLTHYTPRLQQTLAASVPDPPRLQITSLGDQAVATGALRRGIEYVEGRLFEELGATPAENLQRRL